MAFIPRSSVEVLRAMADVATALAPLPVEAPPHDRGVVRTRDAALGHTSFHKLLIQALADPYTRRGRTTREAVAPTTQHTYEMDVDREHASGVVRDGVVHDRSAVLDARYSMGRNDSAYLNAPVLPLQSMVDMATSDDTRRLGAVLEPEFERAQRQGMYSACAEVLDVRARTTRAALSEALRVVGWLLSIDDIAAYCRAALEAEGRTGAIATPTQTAALRVLDGFKGSGANAAHILSELGAKEDAEFNARCALLRLVLRLFQAPLEYATEEENRVLLQSLRKPEAGVATLRRAVERVAAVQASLGMDPPAVAATPGPGPDPNTLCNDGAPPIALDQVGDDKLEDHLCAAVAQMTEALTQDVSGPGLNTLRRSANVSPFWRDARGNLDRSTYWKQTLIPTAAAARANARATDVATAAATDAALATPRAVTDAAVAYALARGLCGRRGVHQRGLLAAWLEGLETYAYRAPGGDNPTPPSPAPRRALLSDAVRAHWRKREEQAAQPGEAALAPDEAAFVAVLRRLASQSERVQAEDAYLPYHVPRAPWPSVATLQDFRSSTADAVLNAAIGAVAPVAVTALGDVASIATLDREEPRLAQWAPVSRGADANNGQFLPSLGDGVEGVAARAISSASVLEHLCGKCRETAAAQPSAPEKATWLARAAAAKLLQLRHVAATAKLSMESAPLCPAEKQTANTAQGKRMAAFVTRPAQPCAFRTMYPCDAGLAVFTYDPTGLDLRAALGQLGPGNVDRVAAGQVGGDGSRAEVDRKEVTQTLQAMETGLYLAPVAPGAPEGVPSLPLRDVAGSAAGAWYPVALDALGGGEIDVAPMQPGSLRTLLRQGLAACEALKHIQRERADLEASRRDEAAPAADGAGLDRADAMARRRRQTVWSDGLREAALANDRLYAFARQLGGAIGEPISEVAEVDDSQLATESRETRRQRARTAERAATQHMQLVRDVMEQVLKSSDLTLGIGANGEFGGDIRNLKVVSGTLRKEARELSKLKEAGSSSDRFFGNAVALENLLSAGTGEMTLQDLLERLRDAGLAMQRAALADAEQQDGVAAPGTTTEFLSAPRNSLMLRWKPEAQSAIREAFAVFSTEMRARHPYTQMHPIHAYELIEGNDMELCTLFATLCGVKMANSRIYSSSSSAYVGAFAAAANAQQMRITLAKVCRRACEYLQRRRSMGLSREAYHG